MAPNNNEQKIHVVAAASAATLSINEAKLGYSKPQAPVASVEAGNFTAFFAIVDEKGNVIVGKLELRRALTCLCVDGHRTNHRKSFRSAECG
jgi:hypothetical protein